MNIDIFLKNELDNPTEKSIQNICNAMSGVNLLYFHLYNDGSLKDESELIVTGREKEYKFPVANVQGKTCIVFFTKLKIARDCCVPNYRTVAIKGSASHSFAAGMKNIDGCILQGSSGHAYIPLKMLSPI